MSAHAFRLSAAAALLTATVSSATAAAEPMVPALGVGCPEAVSDAMTLLPDQQTYAICQQSPLGYTWAWVQTPFDPHETWWSYGPEITLHGQGMRNPNVSSGRWTATPQDPESVCRAEQQTVVGAGVLSPPRVAESEAGKTLSVEFLPKLFYLKLSGDCLWAQSS